MVGHQDVARRIERHGFRRAGSGAVVPPGMAEELQPGVIWSRRVNRPVRFGPARIGFAGDPHLLVGHNFFNGTVGIQLQPQPIAGDTQLGVVDSYDALVEHLVGFPIELELLGLDGDWGLDRGGGVGFGLAGLGQITKCQAGEPVARYLFDHRSNVVGNENIKIRQPAEKPLTLGLELTIAGLQLDRSGGEHFATGGIHQAFRRLGDGIGGAVAGVAQDAGTCYQNQSVRLRGRYGAGDQGAQARGLAGGNVGGIIKLGKSKILHPSQVEILRGQ